MPAIDVHTHMLTLDNLELARQRHRKMTLKNTRAGQDCRTELRAIGKTALVLRA